MHGTATGLTLSPQSRLIVPVVNMASPSPDSELDRKALLTPGSLGLVGIRRSPAPWVSPRQGPCV